MEKTYDPAAIETRWYDFWETQGHFSPAGDGAPYCIAIPPPNVTGRLHMGHAFQDTVMDLLIRYHRMRGHCTLWQVGTDHAGIATQMVVERQLAAAGKQRQEIGREAFEAEVWRWKARSGGDITAQLRRLGASTDWHRERFTMDETLSHAVREVFVRLYEEGLIYRGTRLVNWDPKLLTAISDLEVVSEEETGHLWHFRYPLVDGSGHLEVATTRPETMLGDSAVAVHPDDARYRHLIGQRVQLPLAQREIPIIADAYVDPEFGTGCVKITPAHDFNDYEVGLRHDLPQINIFTPDARINDAAPQRFRGLDRFEARQRVVAELESSGLLGNVVDHKLMVPRGDRTGEVIEPYLTDQWYVRIAPLAEPAIAAVERGDIQFVPQNWERTYFEWMRNIQDWCISRQLWWGHRIPAWYDAAGNVYVARDETEVRSRYGLDAALPLSQDEDVLDTWFSSALWPFSTQGWPERTADLERFYPTDVLVTGFDIIFFWVARMIMMGLKFTGDVPFRQVYIHGLVRDQAGQKMSKSKGNILDPLDLIDGIGLEELVQKRTEGLMQPEMAPAIETQTRRDYPQGIPGFGTDALRFTFASLATQGRDVRFDLARIEGYRNFCTKLWNAARFVLMNCEGQACAPGDAGELGAAERWIRGELGRTAAQIARAIEDYRFDFVAQSLYQFVWDRYCDWYIELAKITLNDADTPASRQAAVRHTLVTVLEATLRMAHPVIPFITEEIWQQVAPLAGSHGSSIMVEPYPQAAEWQADETADAAMRWVIDLVGAVRNMRGEMNISPTQALPALLDSQSPRERRWMEEHRSAVCRLARLDGLTLLDTADRRAGCAVAMVGEGQLLVPMADVIDVAAELGRLDKQIAKLDELLERSARKLANPAFTEKAPGEVVAQERERRQEHERQRDELCRQRSRIATL